MVSFHTPISPTKNVPQIIMGNSSNKRKFSENFAEQESLKSLKPEAQSLDSVELQLETPLPLDWQRCLDIQSGKVHFFNTWTKKRTSRDPRGEKSGSQEPPSKRAAHMSLELELNLPCDPYEADKNENQSEKDKEQMNPSCEDLLLKFGLKNNETKLSSSSHMSSSPSAPVVPSWLASEGDEKSEMVATVCKRCFMLVMLCKASPACPNCKFMHTPDQSAPYLFKRRFTQLLY